MGDVGDYWREAKKARKRPQPGQYVCECGCFVWKRKPDCAYCKRPNPHKAAKAAATK